MPKKQKRYIITLDQFFKRSSQKYFSAKECEVHIELELITGAKRVDVVIVKKDKNTVWEDTGVFSYFLEYNLISFKSFRDTVSRKDIQDCFIYYNTYLQTHKEAKVKNTTITLLSSKIPKSIVGEYPTELVKTAPGCYRMENEMIKMRLLNIEKMALEGEDGFFLSIFCKDRERIVAKGSVKSRRLSQKMLDIVKELAKFRLHYFEGEQLMKAAQVDITDYVLPELEKAEAKGKREGKIENASVMFAKGYPLEDVIEITGLSKRQLKNADLI